jgi:hypothetical protein
MHHLLSYSTGKRLLKIFATTIAIMAALLIAVNIIPDRPIADNIRKSISNFDLAASPLGAPIDSWTECVAVATGVFADAKMNPIRKAFLAPTPLRGCDDVKAAFEGRPAVIVDYWRYWHGYQIICRPLLFFFGLRTLHHIIFLGFCISAFIFYESIRAHIGPAHAIFALVGLLCVSGPVYSAVYLVSHNLIWPVGFLGATYILSTTNKYGDDQVAIEGNLIVFFVIGMMTAFIDFLTTPLITLTIPLIALYWFERDRCVDTGRLSGRKISILCSGWAMGYVGCWVMKWVIMALVFNVGVVDELFEQITFRLSGEILNGPDVTVEHSYELSFQAVRHGFEGLAGFFVFKVMRNLWWQGRFAVTNPFRSTDDAIAFSIIFALPLLWIATLRNYTVMHPHFVPAVLYGSFVLAFWLVNEAVGTRSPVRSVQRGAVAEGR